MEELILGSGFRITPTCYSSSTYDGHPRIYACYGLTKIFHLQDWYASPKGWSVLKLWWSRKSTLYHSMICIWFRKVLFLLSVESLGNVGMGTSVQLIILNHRYNKGPAKELLNYSLQKVQLLVFSDPRFLLWVLCVIAQTGVKAENWWK